MGPVSVHKMTWRRDAALLIAAVTVMACGASARPGAQTSPPPTHQPSPTATFQAQSSPSSVPTAPSTEPSPATSPVPTPTAALASVTCSGGPSATMAVVAGTFVYDVADPIHPRLVCRGANTAVHLVDSKAMAYTRATAGHVVIVRRD